MTPWLLPLWLALLVAGSAALTAVYTCITPFAAFAVLGALTLSGGRAVLLTVALWLANQAVGFFILSYPWTGKTLAWGVAIGAAAVIGTLGAKLTIHRVGTLRAPARIAAAFVAAFALDQLALYAAAATLLGGTGAFVAAIVGRVLVINAVVLIGLIGLRQLVTAAAPRIRWRRAQGLGTSA